MGFVTDPVGWQLMLVLVDWDDQSTLTHFVLDHCMQEDLVDTASAY